MPPILSIIIGNDENDDYMEFEQNGEVYNNNKGVDWYLGVYEKNNLAINFYKAEGFNIESKKIDKYTNEKELIMKWTKL